MCISAIYPKPRTTQPNKEHKVFLYLLRGLKIERCGKPEIFNTDQGSEFTCSKFVEILQMNDIQISMDGKGRALDNIFIERLWRSLKYEYTYLSKPTTDGLKAYFANYNSERLHQSLDYKTPKAVYVAAAKGAYTYKIEKKSSEIKIILTDTRIS